VGDGSAAAVEAKAPDMATAFRTRRSTDRSVKNATTNYKRSIEPNGKQSSEQKKDLAKSRTPTVSAMTKKNGEGG